MYIFIIINIETDRVTAVGGPCSDWTKCARRAGLNPEEWYLDDSEYID